MKNAMTMRKVPFKIWTSETMNIGRDCVLFWFPTPDFCLCWYIFCFDFLIALPVGKWRWCMGRRKSTRVPVRVVGFYPHNTTSQARIIIFIEVFVVVRDGDPSATCIVRRGPESSQSLVDRERRRPCKRADLLEGAICTVTRFLPA